MWILGLKELIVAINFRLCYMYVTVTRACRLSRFHPNSVSLVGGGGGGRRRHDVMVQ